METQVWAVNKCAAIPPAMAGAGRYRNNSGTTRNPKVVRLPHQRAATIVGRRLVEGLIPGFTRS